MIQNAFDETIVSQDKLDLSFWQAYLDELLEYMKAHGYCGHYCK